MLTLLRNYTAPVGMWISLVFLLTSCVKDGLDNCPTDPDPGPGPDPGASELRLYFDYDEVTYAAGSTRAVDPADVDRMSVFVFDDNNLFVKLLEEDITDFSRTYYMSPALSPGTYRYVVWGNLRDGFTCSHSDPQPGVTTLDEMLVELYAGNDEITQIPQHLYFGNLATVRVTGIGEESHTVKINRSTYTIHLYTRGLETDPLHKYQFVIADHHAGLRFDNTIDPTRSARYLSAFRINDQAQLNGTLNVLRLAEEYDTALVSIVNTTTGNVIFEDNLMRLLLSLRDKGVEVDFSKIYEYTIGLVFNRNTVVAIVINGWTVYEDEHQIWI